MPVALAATLSAPSEFVMLDKPTNHLDLDKMLWLEDHFSKVNKTQIVLSHSPLFSNHFCMDIFHTDRVEKKLSSRNDGPIERTA
jgi:ATPase subunit of ABC transporter with duplicated ATPase domains